MEGVTLSLTPASLNRTSWNEEEPDAPMVVLVVFVVWMYGTSVMISMR